MWLLALSCPIHKTWLLQWLATIYITCNFVVMKPHVKITRSRIVILLSSNYVFAIYCLLMMDIARASSISVAKVKWDRNYFYSFWWSQQYCSLTLTDTNHACWNKLAPFTLIWYWHSMCIFIDCKWRVTSFYQVRRCPCGLFPFSHTVYAIPPHEDP